MKMKQSVPEFQIDLYMS